MLKVSDEISTSKVALQNKLQFKNLQNNWAEYIHLTNPQKKWKFPMGFF